MLDDTSDTPVGQKACLDRLKSFCILTKKRPPWTRPGGRDAIESEMAKIGQKAVLPPLVPFNSLEWPWKTDPSKGTGPKSFDDQHKSGPL
jgi:hypothetical protein